MPKTVTLSDSDLAALHAIRQAVADVAHPARPAAIAVLDRIAAAPDDSVWSPTVTRSGQQPLDLSQPDGHRCATLEWRSDWPETDIKVPVGEDLHLALVRPNGDIVMRWAVDVGDPKKRRAAWRLSFSAFTRPPR